MEDWITSEIRQAFLNRRVTLWLGPSYGWEPGTSNKERNRNAADESLARVPWRAVYSESPVPVLEETISDLETEIRQEDRAAFRRPFAIGSPGQDENLVLTQFLPFYYLNGRLRARNREDKFGELPNRVRSAFRSNLILNLRNIAQEEGVLILLGFNSDELTEAVEEVRAFAGNTIPILVLEAPQFMNQ